MALTKEKKVTVIKEVSDLLMGSKMTVIAKYEGTGVKALQTLRRDAKQKGTTVKVVKNRLVIQAIKSTDKLKEVDTSLLEGMLLYAFNVEDEVAPAQSLYDFAKQNPTLQFVGAITSDGELLDPERVSALAQLPSKELLLAGIISLLNGPIQGIVSGLSGGLPNIISALEAHAK